MPNNLPAYFEELINNKFAETNKKIDDLARVKDDIKGIQKQIFYLVLSVVVLYILHVDQFGPVFLSSLKKFIGI